MGGSTGIGIHGSFSRNRGFPRKEGHIDMVLAGMLDFAVKKPTSTVVPLIVAEMYRALTICRKEFGTMVTCVEFPKGTEAWLYCLRSLIAVYTSAKVPYIILMGVRSIHPYAPYRVLRQFGRFQTVHDDEDLSGQIIELGPNAVFPEDKVRKIWNECRYLEPKTIVHDLVRGEVDPEYLT